MSDEQKSELVKARNMDENDFQAYRKGEEKRRTMRQQKAQTDINIMQAKLAELMVTCRKYEDELEKMDVVGPEEQNLSAIETLISLIQSHRANSITEALLQYDEQKRYEHQQIMRRLKEQQEAIVAKYKAMDDFNKAMDDLAYKNRMESIERKKLDELERIRKDAEFYRRYGNP